MIYDSARRDLLRELAVSQYKLKDQSTFFGFLWSFLHPLLLLAVLYSFFSAQLGAEVEHYGVYLLIGLVIYTHFSNSTALAMSSLRNARDLVTDAVFPKELLVLGTVLSSSIEFVISMVICVLIALATGVAPTLALLWLPVVILIELLLVSCVGFLLAALYPFAWDIDHLYSIFLRALLFLTPVFYHPSFLGDSFSARIVEANPLAYVMAATRSVIIDGQTVPLVGLAGFAALSIAVLFVAIALFRHLEPSFAEHV
jgi:ABC-type polysaccharide/polyol phosphate export permease